MHDLKSGYLYLLLFAKEDIANFENFDYLYLLLFSKYENASRNVWLVIFNFIYKR